MASDPPGAAEQTRPPSPRSTGRMSRTAGSASRSTRPTPPRWRGGSSAIGPASIPGWSPRRTAACSAIASSSPFRTRPAYRWTRRDRHLPRRRAPRAAGSASACLCHARRAARTAGLSSPRSAPSRCPTTPASASTRALGFIHAGTYRGTGFKLGQWIDVGLWQKRPRAATPEPSEPLPSSRCSALGT